MKVNYNNYLSLLSWGWLATILHSIYWVIMIYSNHKRNQSQHVFLDSDQQIEGVDNNVGDRQENEILQLRMLHYILMCFGCLLFTILTICLSYFCKNKNMSIFGYKISPNSMNKHLSNSSNDRLNLGGLLNDNQRMSGVEIDSGDQNNMAYSGYTTSYQQHSSSAEERRYMQQQLMQFNRSLAQDTNNENADGFRYDRDQHRQDYQSELSSQQPQLQQQQQQQQQQSNQQYKQIQNQSYLHNDNHKINDIESNLHQRQNIQAGVKQQQYSNSLNTNNNSQKHQQLQQQQQQQQSLEEYKQLNKSGIKLQQENLSEINQQQQQQQQQQYNPFNSVSRQNDDSDFDDTNRSMQSMSNFNSQSNNMVENKSDTQHKTINNAKVGNAELKEGLLEHYKQQITSQNQQQNIETNYNKNSNSSDSSGSNSQINKNRQREQQLQQQQQLYEQQQQQFMGQITRSQINFNGDIQVSKDHKNIKVSGTFSWSIVCHNYKLHLVFLISSILNVMAQLKLASSIDQNLSYNLPYTKSTFIEELLCFLQVNSLCIILILFAVFHHFLIYPDTDQGKSQQKEDNLASGIYMMLGSVTVCIVLNLIIQHEDSYVVQQTLIAWCLIGTRVLIVRIYLDLLPRNDRPSCFVINMFQIWGEFTVFIIYLLIWKPSIFSEHTKPILFSTYDILQEAGISLLYLLSLICFNTALIRQSLFQFMNQYNLSSALIVVVIVIYTQLLSIRFIIEAILAVFTFIFIKYCGEICIKFCSQYYSQRKQKGQIYGKKFQEEHYERLLPTPYASGVQENQYYTDQSQSDPQLRQSYQPHQKYQPTYPRPQLRSNFEYYIVENEVSLLLKKRPCLDLHYKFNSIQHFSLRFYSINSMDLSQSQDTNNIYDNNGEKLQENEQRIFLKAIENYQRKIYQ